VSFLSYLLDAMDGGKGWDGSECAMAELATEPICID